MGSYGGVTKPVFLWGRDGKNIAGFTFLEFPLGLNELATRQHTQSALQTFTEDEVLVLPGGVDQTTWRWVFAV